jgi:hypothetical protein
MTEKYKHLIETFKPIIIFDSDEIFFPSTIEYAWANSDLLYFNPSPNPTHIPSHISPHHTPDPPTHYLTNESARYGFNSKADLSKAPYYTFVEEYEHFYSIYYGCFFPFQNNQTFCQLFTLSPCQEFNFYFLNFIIDKKTNQLQKIYFNGLEEWVDYKTITYKKHNLHNNPIIYFSKYNRKFYPFPGIYWNYIVNWDQNNGKGYQWFPLTTESLDNYKNKQNC